MLESLDSKASCLEFDKIRNWAIIGLADITIFLIVNGLLSFIVQKNN